ncbi:MAG: TIGR02680 family protein [Planctomycetota bacterium]
MNAPLQDPLPRPTTARWQPLRCGLLNLFKYDHEEFRFERGRLLLRGNNGAGKSRVLALTLPFLLDGETRSSRLEPDGDQAKRMSWNLLMDRHADRQGYTWLELGRAGEEGEEYLTLGCGLKAVQGRGSVETWFFVTPQRIGRDLYLQGQTGCALGRKLLESALAAHPLGGELFQAAQDYRRAVDRALFQLGEERYQALLNLLIELRKPQLSRKLEEDRLSAALSEALAPLSERVLGQVAEAFRGLEDERQALARYEVARAAVRGFRERYGHYVRIAARRRAGEVRSTHSAVEETARRARAQEQARDAAADAQRRAEEARQELVTARDRTEARERALRESPLWQEAAQLERVEREAEQAEQDAARARREERRGADELGAAEGEEAQARAREAERRAELLAHGERAARAAEPLGVERGHAAALEPLALPDPADASALAQARRAAQALAEERRGAVAHLGQLDREVEGAERELTQGKLLQTRAQEDLDRARGREERASLELAREGEALLQAFLGWSRELRALRLDAPDQLAEELAAWVEAPEGHAPHLAPTRAARDRATQELLERRAARRHERDEAQARCDALRAERTALESGRHVPPLLLLGRDPEARLQRPGAPLWRVVDFRPELGAEAQAGLEAALEAAGLLDAWIAPGGELLRRGPDGELEHEAVLAAGRSARPAEGASLLRVLVPAIDEADVQASALTPELVREVLSHLGSLPDTGEAWVAEDGRYQLGPLHGAWTKAQAEHVGEGARAERRRRRLAELALELEAAQAELQRLESELEALEQRRARLDAELAACPEADGVQRVAHALEAARATVGSEREKLRRQEARVIELRSELESREVRRREEASALHLVAWIGRAPALERALGDYERALEALWPGVSRRLDAAQLTARSVARAAAAREELEERRERAVALRARSEQAAERARTLRAAIGADADRLRADLAEAERELLRLRADLERAEVDLRRAESAAAVAETKLQALRETQADQEQERGLALGRWGDFARARLLPVADLAELGLPGPEGWTLTQAVHAAREAERRLQEVDADDRAWERAQKTVQRHVQELLNALLPHGYQPEHYVQADVIVVTILDQGRPHTPVELADALGDEIEQRRRILSERERDVLEKHLVGEVATQLHERLRAAEEVVRDMNQELARCPTSTGVELKFSWEPLSDGPAGLSEARQRLLSTGATWSVADREALGAFLQERIEDVRQELQQGAVGTWQEALRRALDYRAWHGFLIHRRQEGQWRRLTRRTHGTGSGGEKAIALTIPQLAAAAAHYRSAAPCAPRLILLDEAFVGVDDGMRAKCMGLMEAFELDFVMTSEREWGCYPTLQGLAICQLATAPGVDAVHVTRWVWNGRERVLDERPISDAAPPELDDEEEGVAGLALAEGGAAAGTLAAGHLADSGDRGEGGLAKTSPDDASSDADAAGRPDPGPTRRRGQRAREPRPEERRPEERRPAAQRPEELGLFGFLPEEP